jgi:sugar phosphate permease
VETRTHFKKRGETEKPDNQGNLKSTKMKTQKVLNITAFALVVIGLLFKSLHWPGANIAILLSGVTMLLTLFMFAMKDNTEAGIKDSLNIFMVGTLSLWIIGAIFKILHWQGAQLLVIIAYILNVLFPLVLLLQKNEFKISRQFLITLLIFMLLVLGSIPNNPISRLFAEG